MKNYRHKVLIALTILLFASCKMQEQIRTIKQTVSSASRGDVSATLKGFDTTERVSNPLVNMKYQKMKKKYRARFTSNTEKNKKLSNNSVINDICSLYHEYWKTKLQDTLTNSDSILYNNITHYLIDNKLTDISFDTLIKTVINDSELTKVIEKEGFYSKFLISNGTQDLLIWDKQSKSDYFIILPENEIDINVIFIENYILEGATNFATIGSHKIGGWASSESSSLFCNKGAYMLKSETFQISYLKHEAIHFVDLKNYPNLESADLEYRAKLVELTYCTKKTIYKRLDEFIIGASNKTRNKPHPYANYYLINNLSKKIFNVEFEEDILKWKSLTPELINNASLEILEESSQILNDNRLIKRII